MRIAARLGGAGLNSSTLKSPLILFNSIKNWTTAGQEASGVPETKSVMPRRRMVNT